MRNKNKSNKIKEGTVLRTRDEFILGGIDTKTNHPNKRDLYRAAVVTETNKNDELGIVKLTTKDGRKLSGKTNYKPFIHIFDDEGRYIKSGKKFVVQKKQKLSRHDVNEIKKSLYKDKSTSRDLRRTNGDLIHNFLKKRK